MGGTIIARAFLGSPWTRRAQSERSAPASVDVHLAAVFQQWGIPCDTAAERGWKALANGELMFCPASFFTGARCWPWRWWPFFAARRKAVANATAVQGGLRPHVSAKD
jgi:hypothetical protein